MSPDWWERAMETAMERHDAEAHEGREWDELSVEEQELAIAEVLDDIIRAA